MAYNFSPKIVTNGLILYLDAANTNSYVSGDTTWNDLTKDRRVGNLINGPTFNSSNGGSLVFDGTDDYTIFPSINMSNQTVSFCAFVKPTGFGVGSTVNSIVRKGDANPNDYIFCIRDSYLGMDIEYSNDATISIGNTLLTNGLWYHLAGTWDGVTIRFYVNGNPDGEVSRSTTISDDGRSTYVGGRTGSIDVFNGNIAVVQMYNRTLSISEIKQNYNTLKGRFGLI